MNTQINRNTGIAAFAAVVIVGLTGLTLNSGHQGALPQAVIEVGTPETLAVGGTLVAALPEVQVLGAREVTLARVDRHADPQG